MNPVTKSDPVFSALLDRSVDDVLPDFCPLCEYIIDMPFTYDNFFKLQKIVASMSGLYVGLVKRLSQYEDVKREG